MFDVFVRRIYLSEISFWITDNVFISYVGEIVGMVYSVFLLRKWVRFYILIYESSRNLAVIKNC